MAKRLTDLDVRLLDDNNGERAVWKLLAPFRYMSDIYGLIEVQEGFETDFASVPRLAIAFAAFGGRANWEAVVHDWLYRDDVTPKDIADKVFLEAMESDGEPKWRRWLMYKAVSIFGKR